MESERTSLSGIHGVDYKSGTVTIENMIILTATLRQFHTEAALTLRPVRMSDDKTELELDFYWLPRPQRGPQIRIDLQGEPQSSHDWLDSDPGSFSSGAEWEDNNFEDEDSNIIEIPMSTLSISLKVLTFPPGSG
ncbi:hypothetical protein GQ43DRAFT_496634 [Delitschia confertaspora ATCC 74209]|uniref:Uncharacterized protein n=1 Tax=Delitschia confertaspora ATCC 74209 TaxID=1513339 RepID=A0A9P4MUN9_9PLEO|nr:hypothetical protein GQ43DRAFT_496634 [Delitschia confertaspora ATCC 74209]